jgi:hypothetical protein
MNSYAMINMDTNVVENLIAWDGIVSYSPPEGYFLVKIEDPQVNISWLYVDGQFISPIPEPIQLTENGPVLLAD